MVKYDIEKRGSHIHITLYLEPNPEPIGFLRLKQDEYEEILPHLKNMYEEIFKQREASAPRIISGKG